MKPISKNKLITDFAKENELDRELVNGLITLYWKQLKLDMTELIYPRIKIPYFGTMFISRVKVEKGIIKHKTIGNMIPPTSFSNFEKYKKNEIILKKLEDLKILFANEREKQYKFYENKKKPQL